MSRGRSKISGGQCYTSGWRRDISGGQTSTQHRRPLLVFVTLKFRKKEDQLKLKSTSPAYAVGPLIRDTPDQRMGCLFFLFHLRKISAQTYRKISPSYVKMRFIIIIVRMIIGGKA
jgi:hypothetical protein